jgi:hypothetical protein
VKVLVELDRYVDINDEWFAEASERECATNGADSPAEMVDVQLVGCFSADPPSSCSVEVAESTMLRVNKAEVRKLVGQCVRLQPSARRAGVPLDYDWLVVAADDESLTLEHAGTAIAVLGLDGIRSYFSDPSRNTSTRRHGWLQLLVQIDITSEGKTSIAPLALHALTTPAARRLETDTGRLAAERYRSLWPMARAAIAYLSVVGSATEQQITSTLGPIGFADGQSNALGRIAQATQLVQQVHQEDTKATRLLGYRGPFMLNPSFADALRELARQDDELQRLWASLR